jgi:zinc-ribbon domain
VRLHREFVYLAVLRDVFTRCIRGWHLGCYVRYLGCYVRYDEMRVCSSCGRENPDDARFCNRCGIELGTLPKPRSAPGVTP